MNFRQMTREDLDDLAHQDAKERDAEKRGTLAFLLSMPFILFLTAAAAITVALVYMYR